MCVCVCARRNASRGPLTDESSCSEVSPFSIRVCALIEGDLRGRKVNEDKKGESG